MSINENKDNAPYPGLRPYREDEKAKFFGRDVDAEILIDKVLTNRLTLLFAASGVGKSSLLQAAVIPHLKSKTGENLTVVYHTDWVSDPVHSVRDAVLQALRVEGLLPEHSEEAELGEKLPDLLAFCEVFVRPPLVLILDQFEEFFRYQRHQTGFRELIDQLTTIITDKSLPVHLILSMREDFALELNAFKPKLPTILFENFYRLEKLGRQAVRDAIVIPAEQRGFTYEPELLKQLLADLLSREMDRQPNSPVAELLETVEPPYMQIVCARLWELNEGDSEKVLRLASYEKAGRAKGILKNYLDGVLQRFSFAEKQLASAAFDHLVSLRGVKMAYTAKGLAETVRVDEGELAKVLKRLESIRVLREIPRQDELWYELYHDMFSGSIEDWNNAWKDRMRRRRAAKIAGGVVFGVGVIFAGWDYYLNVSNYHFRLSPKQSSEQVELWRGKPGSFDLFGVQEYVAETGVRRHDLEPDKQFNQRLIAEYNDLQIELVGEQAIEERITAYAERGEIDKALELAKKSIYSQNTGLAERALHHLAALKASEAIHFLYLTYQRSQNTRIKVSAGNKISLSSKVILIGDKKRFSLNKKMPFREQESWLEFFKQQILTKSLLEDFLKFSKKNSSKKIKESFFEIISGSPDHSKTSFELSKLYKSKNPRLRLSAISAMKKIKATESIPTLITAIDDKYTDIRVEAIEALGNMKAKDATSKLLKILKVGNEDVQVASIKSLSKINSKKLKPYLLPLFESKSEKIRISVIKALGSTKIKTAIPKLILGVGNKNENISDASKEALYKFPPEDTNQFMLTALSDNSLKVRVFAANILGKSKVKKAAPKLLNLVNADDPIMRGSAIIALTSIKPEGLTPKLLIALNDTNQEVRRASAYSLARLKMKEAVPELLKLLKRSNKYHSAYIAKLIGYLKAEEAAPELLKSFMEEDDEYIRSSILDALKNINIQKDIISFLGIAENYLPEEGDYYSKKDPFLLIFKDILSVVEDEGVFNQLIPLLSHRNRRVRTFSIKALEKKSSTRATSLIAMALNDDDLGVRRAAVIALGSLRSEKSIPKLVEAFENKKLNYRDSIINALGNINYKKNHPIIFDALEDKNKNVIIEAINVLNRARDRRSIPKLLKLLKSEDFYIRRSAINALSSTSSVEAVPELLDFFNEYGVTIRVTSEWHGIKAREILPDIRDLQKIQPYQSLNQTLSTAIVNKYGVNDLTQVENKYPAELMELLLKNLKDADLDIQKFAAITALRMARSENLNQVKKYLLHKALIQVDQKTIATAKKRLAEEDQQEAEEKANRLNLPVNQPGLEKTSLTLTELKQKLKEQNQAYADWRKHRDAEQPPTTNIKEAPTTEATNSLEDPAPFIYEYAYAIAHESESEGIKLLGHNLYKVREAAARGLANGDALGVELLKKLEKAWLETKDPIERQGIYHAIDIALLAIEGVGYKKELADLKTYEPTLTNERSAASIKPRVEWTRIQLQWRVDANKELEELAARQLPKLLKEYCLNEDGTDMKPEECTMEQ